MVMVSLTIGGGSTGGITGLSFLQESAKSAENKRTADKINLFIISPKYQLRNCHQQERENDGTQYSNPPMSAGEIYKINIIKVKPARQLLVLIWQAG
jgi:hypothetical protein